MNKKVLFTLCALIIGGFALEFLISHNKPKLQNPNPVIGIIIPITHPAIDKIVAGFCSELTGLLDGKCSYVIRDAQGDQNAQQPAIIDEMKRKNVDIIVPIGTLCTQMTIQMAPSTPVVALAAAPASISAAHNFATGIHDEIDAKASVELIQHLIPSIEKVALIATQNEKTIPEVQTFRSEAMNRGIAVQVIYVQNQSDMYLATHSIDDDVQAIHIFKDNMVASCIATINQVAQERQIPVVTSDEGSVEAGAACALGVEETTIGTAGAHLALKVLTGTPPGDIPMQNLTEFAVFVNRAGCDNQNASIPHLLNYARSKNYRIIYTKQHAAGAK